MKFVIAAQARDDLVEIWEYVARDNESAADRLIDRFFARFVDLTNNPLIGEQREDLASGLRQTLVGAYVVAYKPVIDLIDVLSIIHSARDLPVVFRRRFESGEEPD